MPAFFMAVIVFTGACSDQPSGGTGPDVPGGDSGQPSDETGTDSSGEGGQPSDETASGTADGQPSDGTVDSGTDAASPWMNVELKDVATGNTFTISEFGGRPVLVELFAVWCPICTRQQQESKKLEEMEGHDIVSVAINADLNEDEEFVREHIERHGFDWRYAVARSDFINPVIEDFGTSIVHAPSAPMILVCSDQTVHRLRNGVKPADELRDKVSELCGA